MGPDGVVRYLLRCRTASRLSAGKDSGEEQVQQLSRVLALVRASANCYDPGSNP